MDKQNRKAIIAGNWKMNKTATEAKALISELIPAVKDAGCEVCLLYTSWCSVICAILSVKLNFCRRPLCPTSAAQSQNF